MKPKQEPPKNKPLSMQDKLCLKFPGLAIPNEVQEKESKEKLKSSRLSKIKEEEENDIVDDAMAALEALAPSNE